MPRCPRSLGCPAAVLALGLALAPGPLSAPGLDASRDARALEILRRADAATAAVGQLRYDYEYLGLGVWSARIVGEVRLKQITDQTDSWIRTSGTLLARPAGYENDATRYATAIDGRTAYFLDRDRGTVETAPYGPTGNHLTRNQAWEVLYQFVNPDPFRLEIEQSTRLRLLGAAEVGGVACDVVAVHFPPGLGTDEALWYFGREDGLPRATKAYANLDGRTGFYEFTITNLRTDVDYDRADFRLQPVGDHEIVAGDVLRAGMPAPRWALQQPGGGTVSSDDLAGRVVVLDFWVSHCPFCKATVPVMQALWRDYRDRPFALYGVNVWEPGDPVAYARQAGIHYPLLLHGEELADRFGIAWQPALVVIGPDGTIVRTGGGVAAYDPVALRAAIDAALADVAPASGKP